ncbi:Hypothetical predicted protein [Podarcis lilfordi]|uniref:Uncharacterized protein n=1 Tax=Podarcis lilfordi TaxID=74358 RepID=A0AA35LM76_9SAUR|nr:Hypothetical predicted protein [Podarcis lilfordi]
MPFTSHNAFHSHPPLLGGGLSAAERVLAHALGELGFPKGIMVPVVLPLGFPRQASDGRWWVRTVLRSPSPPLPSLGQFCSQRSGPVFGKAIGRSTVLQFALLLAGVLRSPIRRVG